MKTSPHNELIKLLKENFQNLLFIFLNVNTAFITGYLVFSPIPFLYFTDINLLYDISSQLYMFIIFGGFLWSLNLKVNFIEPVSKNFSIVKLIISKKNTILIALSLIMLAFFIDFHVFPSIFIYCISILMCCFLYREPNSAKNIYKRSFKLFFKYPINYFYTIFKPYMSRFLNNTYGIIIAFTFIFLGAQRFQYIKEERKFLYELNSGTSGIASLVGKNADGLIFLTKYDEFKLIPITSIKFMTPVDAHTEKLKLNKNIKNNINKHHRISQYQDKRLTLGGGEAPSRGEGRARRSAAHCSK